MFWQLRKQIRQFFRRFRGKTEYEKSLQSYGKNRLFYYFVTWTFGSIAFMHFLFGYRNPETGEWVLIDPKDMKYVGLPGYEINAYGLSGTKVETKKIKAAIDDDD